MQEILSPFPDITREMNLYIEEQGRFAVHHTLSEKLEELFDYLKSKNNGYLNIVMETLKNIEEESKANKIEVDDKKLS